MQLQHNFFKQFLEKQLAQLYLFRKKKISSHKFVKRNNFLTELHKNKSLDYDFLAYQRTIFHKQQYKFDKICQKFSSRKCGSNTRVQLENRGAQTDINSYYPIKGMGALNKIIFFKIAKFWQLNGSALADKYGN
eukprot:TRINITY_DN9524_c1_g1_i2.p7 TRINITY_DN9524_c1_g1~~TRINITY_DN9524_c1_g1_i2.p7  ORF type:complete len:134 (+),score=3.79 TRINITY_DN9524_c1_g1_i2:1753-2154(+)